jgi:hypothetical protein
MWDETFSIIKQELSSQERLLWSGQPRRGLALRATDAATIPFSLIWAGFAVFWETIVIKSNGPLIMKLWGIPFVLIGLHMVAGRFFVEAWQRGRTTYGLTNERVIIITNFFGTKIKSLNLRTLTDVTLDQKSDEVGTITFGPTEKTSGWNTGTWGGRRSQPAPPSLELIQNARRVYEMIREAQRQLK